MSEEAPHEGPMRTGAAGLLDAIWADEPKCQCGHHRGSHSWGFSATACIWCRGRCPGFQEI